MIYYAYLSAMQFDPGPFYPEYIGGGGSDFAAFAGEVLTEATFRLAGGTVKIYLPLVVKGS